MKNLEELNLKNLSVDESLSIDGGNILIGLVAGWVGTFLYECANDWNANVAAYNAGKNSVKH